MGISKNRQTEETIRILSAKAFVGKEVKEIEELTEGLCNAAYLITFRDSSQTILKIAPKEKKALLSNEINMMKAEVTAMRLVGERTDIPIPCVYFYDDSHTVCDSTYFFMEVMIGKSYYSCKGEMKEESVKKIDREIGIIERKIASIKGTKFGLLGDEEHATVELFDTVRLMVMRVLQDAKERKVDLIYSDEVIMQELWKSKVCFDKIKEPVLVHWDMWEGNIFIEKDQVSGIIDWERAIWGEALMDDRFRRHTRTDSFLNGFGKEEFTDEEKKRILWYDVLLYLTMMTEGAFREYPDDSQYQWVKPLLTASFEELIHLGV